MKALNPRETEIYSRAFMTPTCCIIEYDLSLEWAGKVVNISNLVTEQEREVGSENSKTSSRFFFSTNGSMQWFSPWWETPLSSSGNLGWHPCPEVDRSTVLRSKSESQNGASELFIATTELNAGESIVGAGDPRCTGELDSVWLCLNTMLPKNKPILRAVRAVLPSWWQGLLFPDFVVSSRVSLFMTEKHISVHLE